ncbi:MAG: hypothetical protein HY774_21025 [Acidobacteria bacterium]|nr:hypothetical protein [Acidobacteriota bacterium]
MAVSRPVNLDEYKIQASILLKNLRSTDPEKALTAASRFCRLSHLAQSTAVSILANKEDIKLKHALAVIALENNFPSWAELKHRMEKLDAFRNKNTFTDLYPRRCGGFLNEWYASYETASHHRQQTGGYLLPYKSQFFICTAEYIRVLGLDPDDPDWERIGWNWAKPADQAAWERLNQKLKAIQ